MEILSEKEEKVYNYQLEMTDHERHLLFEYASDNIPTEELDQLLIEWAILDLLKNNINKTLGENE
ncbi:MAG TPA: hypothetical protein VLA13_04040 [Massilibacterium sp.]|nr:hypothetical protein [Massilibacterium sp.]